MNLNQFLQPIVNALNALASRVGLEFKNRDTEMAGTTGAAKIGASDGRTVQEHLTELHQNSGNGGSGGEGSGDYVPLPVHHEQIEGDILLKDFPKNAYLRLRSDTGATISLYDEAQANGGPVAEGTEWHFKNAGLQPFVLSNQGDYAFLYAKQGDVGSVTLMPGTSMVLKYVGQDRYDVIGDHQ